MTLLSDFFYFSPSFSMKFLQDRPWLIESTTYMPPDRLNQFEEDLDRHKAIEQFSRGSGFGFENKKV